MLSLSKNVECRFAVHVPFLINDNDYHLVKEQVHNDDGTITPNLRIITNYERPFYVTKKAFQNHNDKKEYEDIDKVITFRSVQNKLRDNVAKALGKGYSRDNIRRLSSSPYLYGTDLISTSYIKNEYNKACKLSTEFSIATLDIEFDVVSEKKQINLITVVFNDTQNKCFRVQTCILNHLVKGLIDVEGRVFNAINKYIPTYVSKHDIKFELIQCETEIELITNSFIKLHEWKSDILAIWNIDYDIPRILEACARAKVDPKDIFSDPNIPKELRFFEYKVGQKKKVTASGKEDPIKPANQWHTVYCPSSFYLLDAMCVYRQIRSAGQEEKSYSLNSILDKELGIRKLDFKEAEKYIKLRWHQFMQTSYPIEYIVYNMFDCISMLELDLKTKDLAFTFNLFAGITDFSRFKSQPKKLNDAFSFYVYDNYQKVFGTTSSEMSNGFDDDTMDLDEWILALSAHLTFDNGLKCIKELPDSNTSIRIAVADLDIEGAYPSGQECYNMSKETTKKELTSITGISSSIYRMQNINLACGLTNAIEYTTTMFNFPTMSNLLKEYNSSKL